MGNVNMEASQINYRGGSKKMSVEEAIKAAGTEITPEEKEWIDTIPELASQEIIAPEFDAEEGVYAIGDLVIYQGGLYQFTAAHETAGAWNAEEVAAVKVSDELDSLKSGLTNITTALGNVKFAVLDIPNDKTTATLTTTISAQNVVFLSPFPCGANDGYEDITVDLNSGVVTITKPSATYGGANQHFYLLCAYV